MAAGVARLGDLAASPVVATLARAFADAGHDLAIVGGPVRDALLGRPVNDLDFTTDARPDDPPSGSSSWPRWRQVFANPRTAGPSLTSSTGTSPAITATALFGE